MSFLLENYTNLFFCFLKITLLYMLIDQSNLNVCYGCFVELYINTGDCRNLDTLGWGFLTSIVPYNICFFDLSLALFCFHRRRRERESNIKIDLVVCVWRRSFFALLVWNFSPSLDCQRVSHLRFLGASDQQSWPPLETRTSTPNWSALFSKLALDSFWAFDWIVDLWCKFCFQFGGIFSQICNYEIGLDSYLKLHALSLWNYDL